jgi:organic radical activating enzyme
MTNKGDESVDNKSKFMNSAEIMREKLGPALCLAKWKQVSLHLPTGLNNSCYHPPLHSIDPGVLQDNPSALHNTGHKKQQRVMMLKNEKPSECSYCWNIEKHGELSDRHYRSGEPWAADDFDIIKNSTGKEDIVPSYVEVNFNHACNLSCSYCSPQFSSTWQAEVERLGGYPTGTIHNDPSHFVGRNRPIPARDYNPYVEAFWAWWPTLYPQQKHFRMTGGEPLMDKNTYKVFDYVLALPNPDLHLNVTSNFSVEPALFEKYIGYVKQLCNTQIEHFMQYVSLDTGRKEHAEYIRHGLDFNRCQHHVDRFLTEVPHRNSLTFIITMNNLSVLGLQEQLDYILLLRQHHSTTYQRVWFDTPLLRQPAWQSLQILPPAYADILERVADWMELNLETAEDPFHGFKDYEVQRLRRDIAWMREGTDNVEQKRADFYRFFSEHDRRRGTDFLSTFPEMRSFWQECEAHARRT